MAERGFSDDDPVGSTLRASYRRHTTEHIAQLKREGRAASYISNRKSLLAHWRRVLIDSDKASAAQMGRESPFQVSVRQLFNQGATLKGTSRNTGVPLATLKRWLAGGVPNARSARWIPCIERHFALPSGTLGDLLPYRMQPNQSGQSTTAPIAYRERLKTQVSEPYALRSPSDALRQEWLEYVAYKTKLGSSGRGPRRAKSGRWSTTADPVQPKTAATWHMFQGDLYVPTAGLTWSMLSQFLGWLQLDKTKGGLALDSDHALTMANLAREDYVESYVNWRMARSDGAAHDGIFRLLKFVSSLCNPVMGYLTQHRERYTAAVGAASSETDWLAMCTDAHKFAKSFHDDLLEDAAPSRSSLEPIRAVLALPNPLDAIADAVMRLDADRPTTGGANEAVWARDRLLLKLLASNPLRDKNVRLLTYRSDGTGHLRKVDGTWRIAIPRKDFKNARGAARHRQYDMPVRKEVWADIERYLRDYRPMLDAGDSPYVFVSSRRGDGPLPMRGLRRRFEILTRRYLSGCAGVGPHAIRHIVATSILKQRPNDWAAAAWALHDLEETVRTHYAHLASDDAHIWLDPAMSGPFSRM